MYIDFLTVIVPVLFLVSLVLQVLATRRVRRDISFEPEQRRLQLGLIWLIPLLGAAMVLAMLHGEPYDDGDYSHIVDVDHDSPNT